MKKEGNGAEFFDYLSRSQQSENELLTNTQLQQNRPEATRDRDGEDIFHESNPNESNSVNDRQYVSPSTGPFPNNEEVWEVDLQQQHEQQQLTQSTRDNNTVHNRNSLNRQSIPSQNTPAVNYGQQYYKNDGSEIKPLYRKQTSKSSVHEPNNQDYEDLRHESTFDNDQELDSTNARRNEKDRTEEKSPLSKEYGSRKAGPSSTSNHYNESSNDHSFSYLKYPERRQPRQEYFENDPHMRLYSPLLHRPPLTHLGGQFGPSVVEHLASSISPQELNAILEENHFLTYELNRLIHKFHLERLDLQGRLRHLTARVKYLEESKDRSNDAISPGKNDSNPYYKPLQEQDSIKDGEPGVTTESKQAFHRSSYDGYRYPDKGKSNDNGNDRKGDTRASNVSNFKMNSSHYIHNDHQKGRRGYYQPFEDGNVTAQGPISSSPALSAGDRSRAKKGINDQRHGWTGRQRYMKTPYHEEADYYDYPYDAIETEEEDPTEPINEFSGDIYQDMEAPPPIPTHFAAHGRFRKGAPPPPLPLSHLPSPAFMMPPRMHPPPPPLPSVISPLAFKHPRRHYQQQDNMPPPPYPTLARHHLPPSWPMQQQDFIEDIPYLPEVTPTPSRRSSFRRHRRHSRKLDGGKGLLPKYSFSDYEQQQQQPQMESDLFSDQELFNEEDEEHINFLLHRMSMSGPPPPPPPPPSDMLSSRGVPPPPPPPMMNMFNDMMPPHPHPVPVIPPNTGGLIRRVSSRRSAPGGIGN